MSGKRPNTFSAIAILVAIGGLIFWWVNSLSNGDPFWFLRQFSARADWITVYWNGSTYTFSSGDPEYDNIMDAFSAAIAHWAGYEGGVGLSPESLAQYREKGQLLELHYNEPVKVHTRYLFGEARNFWVPMSGTHAKWRRVFAGLTDEPRIGVLDLDQKHFTILQESVVHAVTQNTPKP